MKEKPIDEALRDFQILFRMPVRNYTHVGIDKRVIKGRKEERGDIKEKKVGKGGRFTDTACVYVLSLEYNRHHSMCVCVCVCVLTVPDHLSF